MKREDSLFRKGFLYRFSRKRVFFPLLLSFCFGVFLGSIAVVGFDLFQSQTAIPLLFSGVPTPKNGFFSCFSTILLNALIGLILLFLLGVTAFGAVGIPIFLLCKGISLGVCVQLFFTEESFKALGFLSICYTPGAAFITLLLLLFATRALVFSNSLAKAGFSPQQENLDFQFYFKDFFTFLCFSVLLSFVGALLTILSGLFA